MATTTKKKKRTGAARRPARASRPRLTASTADRHDLYQRAVQCVESEIDFVDDTYRTLRRRRARLLREDFCGTANTSCEWVRRRRTNRAVGVDLDPDPLAWGAAHNLAALTPAQRGRVELQQADVLKTAGGRFDVVLAMNFSYWCLKQRKLLLKYFRNVRRSLADDGVFFLDFYGGSDALREVEEEKPVEGGFTYVWDQARYNPVMGDLTCHIHFRFRDGTRMDRAFSYEWRLWTLPELRDILTEAGFKKITVYCEGDDGDGGGDGDFRPAESCDADDAFIAYIAAEK